MVAHLLLGMLVARASATLRAADLRVIDWDLEDDGSAPQADEQRRRPLAG